MTTDQTRRARLANVVIKPYADEPIAVTLKKFRNRCQKACVMADIARHRWYKSPSEKRRDRVRRAIRRCRKA
jgi:ribosomal protein S21